MVFEPAILLEGWVLREQEPPLLKIGVSAVTGPKEYIEVEWSDIPIEIEYELVGIRQIFMLKAHAHLTASPFESLWNELTSPDQLDEVE